MGTKSSASVVPPSHSPGRILGRLLSAFVAKHCVYMWPFTAFPKKRSLCCCALGASSFTAVLWDCVTQGVEELQDLLSSSWEVMLGLVAGHTSPVLISKLQLVSSKLRSCLATLDTASHLPAFRRKCFGLGLDLGRLLDLSGCLWWDWSLG